MRHPSATEAQDTFGAPWLITFVDMISLLLTFMVAVYASADIADPAWQPAAAALRAAFDGTQAPPPSPAASVGEPAPLPGLRPGYLALVLGEHLQQMPLFAAYPPVYDAAALRLTLPASAVFADGSVDVEPATANELARFAAAVAPVANAVAVIVPPDPAATGFTEASAAADWEGAIGRALAFGRMLAASGLPEGRLSLLAGGGPSTGDGIRVVVEAEGPRR